MRLRLAVRLGEVEAGGLSLATQDVQAGAVSLAEGAGQLPLLDHPERVKA